MPEVMGELAAQDVSYDPEYYRNDPFAVPTRLPQPQQPADRDAFGSQLSEADMVQAAAEAAASRQRANYAFAQSQDRSRAPLNLLASNFVPGLIKMASRPGEIAQSTEPITSAEMVGPATDIALSMVGSGSPFAQTGAVGIAGGKPGAPGSILGLHPTTTPARIRGVTLKEGGYSVNLPSGELPTEGLMVGRYKNTDPRNVVVAQEQFKPAIIKDMAAKNAAELAKEERYLGTWLNPEDAKVYLDVSQRFPADKIRVATKAGERTGQLAGFNIGTRESFPIGNWREFVSSPEYRDRLFTMEKEGRQYLEGQPTKEWWDMHGTPFERVYGEENLPRVAGFSASTAPITNPRDNMRQMTEYMRRYLTGEPIIQPGWRAGPGNVWLSEGRKMPLEQSRIANLEKSARGALDELQLAKVSREARAMTGDPDVAVIDRHQVRLTEDPSRGIYAGPEEGVIKGTTPKKGVGDYDFVEQSMRGAAQMRGRDLRDFSADVWTGIRERIKQTGELFGTKYKSSAIAGESKSYADHLQDLIVEKAARMGISTEKLDHMLRTGNANLLSQMLAASPVLWGAYKAWEANHPNPNTMGGIARQDQYD